MKYYGTELYHFGIPGQKWGQRRWQYEDGSLTPEGRIHYGYGEAREKLANARREYKKNRAYISSRDKAYGILGRMTKEGKASIKDYKESKAKYKEAKKEYKNTKKDIHKSVYESKVKKYSKLSDKATEYQDAADDKWREAKQAYNSMGKNPIQRIVKAVKNNSFESKAYNKLYDEWDKLQERADEYDAKRKAAYEQTGKNYIDRIINNIRYSYTYD